MAKSLPVGPYRRLTDPDGIEVPWYILPFDERGFCSGPKTREHAVNLACSGAFSDIFVFSHGWNTDWKHAISGYEAFINGFGEMRRQQGLSLSKTYRPLLIGVFWPSVTLVMPNERAPQFAGIDAEGDTVGAEADGSVAQEQFETEELAQSLPDERLARYYQLVQTGSADWTLAEARELATILHQVYVGFAPDDFCGTVSPVDAESLLADWIAGFVEDTSDPGSGPATVVGRPKAAPARAAGQFGKLPTPRDIVRITTVRKMKDRAKVIGRNGVGPLLGDLLSKGTGKVRLIGHSYGCEVLLSAVCSGGVVPAQQKVDSALLLQPAISAWCFAAQVHQTGQAGGYRNALDLIRQPIVATYSRHDAPLHDYYHLALTRQGDAGDRRRAFAGDIVPYYAALGGYGPQGLQKEESDCADARLPKVKYPLNREGLRVLGVNGEAHIDGHSDVSNQATYWALFNQVAFF